MNIAPLQLKFKTASVNIVFKYSLRPKMIVPQMDASRYIHLKDKLGTSFFRQREYILVEIVLT